MIYFKKPKNKRNQDSSDDQGMEPSRAPKEQTRENIIDKYCLCNQDAVEVNCTLNSQVFGEAQNDFRNLQTTNMPVQNMALIEQSGLGYLAPVIIEPMELDENNILRPLNSVSSSFQQPQNHNFHCNFYAENYSSSNRLEIGDYNPHLATAPQPTDAFSGLAQAPERAEASLRLTMNKPVKEERGSSIYKIEEEKEERKESHSQGSSQGRRRAKNEINFGEELQQYQGFYEELGRPQSINKNEINYRCKVSTCNKGFSRAQNMVMHLRVHFGVKNYVCNQCGKRFTQKGNKDKHMKLHEVPSLEDRRTFECRLCRGKFTEKHNLQFHLKNMHGVDPKRDE
ncbi:unnamed protein product [Moneuplotes crassus]|uniref:C2H2-type domain-containing protein n=1 Tax=Euplotes crassus TaxID=5936 RepID=A0AAD1XH91_EUPCR|nr:unnamed protein product [Moneuplotes crassus]